MERANAYQQDRQTLLAWMDFQGPPGPRLKSLLRRLEYAVKPGRCPTGHDCSVDFARREIVLARRAAAMLERARGAAAKALAHIRLHSHQEPAAYRDWWHWEALCYAAVFLVPLESIHQRVPAGCSDPASYFACQTDLAKELGIQASVVRLALQQYGLVTLDPSRPVTQIHQAPSIILPGQRVG